MNLRPEGDKVIVRPDTTEELSKGGIIIPDSTRVQQQTAATRGEIVAIGPTARLRFSPNADGVMSEREAIPGDRVIFSKFGGASVNIDRVEHRILYDADIICLIEGEEAEEMPDSRKSMVG